MWRNRYLGMSRLTECLRISVESEISNTECSVRRFTVTVTALQQLGLTRPPSATCCWLLAASGTCSLGRLRSASSVVRTAGTVSLYVQYSRQSHVQDQIAHVHFFLTISSGCFARSDRYPGQKIVKYGGSSETRRHAARPSRER